MGATLGHGGGRNMGPDASRRFCTKNWPYSPLVMEAESQIAIRLSVFIAETPIDPTANLGVQPPDRHVANPPTPRELTMTL